MAPESRDLRWRSIAEQLSNEADPTQSGILVEQLFQALDERDGLPASVTILTSKMPLNPASSSPMLYLSR
jgi:hypothetical protein